MRGPYSDGFAPLVPKPGQVLNAVESSGVKELVLREENGFVCLKGRDAQSA